VSNEESSPHVKVTLQTIYDKQLDNERLLVRTLERLDGLADVPDRLRAVELAQARGQWVERVAYTALSGAILGIGTALFTLITRG
jgi:hypothetical protein